LIFFNSDIISNDVCENNEKPKEKDSTNLESKQNERLKKILLKIHEYTCTLMMYKQQMDHNQVVINNLIKYLPYIKLSKTIGSFFLN
jgi:hypothetical protein